MSIGALIDATVRTVIVAKIDQLTVRVARFRAEERQMVVDIKLNGGAMPNNHWHERHKAEEQLRVAQAALEVLS